MNSSKHIEIFLSILDNEKFVKITDDLTRRIECKIQRSARKIKNKTSKTEYLPSCMLLAIHLESVTELPKFTSYLMAVILLNFLLELQYRILAHHRVTYQSIWLNYCHHSVNQNILLKYERICSGFQEIKSTKG